MKHRFTEDSWLREPLFKALVAALRGCRSDEDMAMLLRDIGTLSELHAWSERLEIARLLGRGLSYRQVAAQTGASTTTVTKVANALENGTGGYRSMLKVHRHQEVRRKIAQVKERSVGGEKIEQNINSNILEKPLEREKSISRPMSPLQKYLGK